MNWIVRTLVGAMVAGLGWKLGADAYEALKDQVKKLKEKAEKVEDETEEGAGATQTHAIDVAETPREEEG